MSVLVLFFLSTLLTPQSAVFPTGHVFRYIENISTAYGTRPSQAEFCLRGCWVPVSATLCSGTPSYERGSWTQELRESQKASGRQWPGPGLVESVGEEVGVVEAVQSAEAVGGTGMGVPKGLWQHQGASTLAESPLSSDSGGAALGWWMWGPGEVGEVAVEG